MSDVVLIADDHALFRTGLKHLIVQLFGDPKVLEAENYTEAMAALHSESALSLILLDLRMPEMDGFTTLGNLVQQAGDVPVVVLSGSSDRNDMQRCFDMGAMGFIPKKEPAQVIHSALQLVLSGGIYVPTEFVHTSSTETRPAQSALSELTGRQIEVLSLLAEGESNKGIARSLSVSEATVKAHLATILKTLGAKNRTQAVIYLQKVMPTEGN